MTLRRFSAYIRARTHCLYTNDRDYDWPTSHKTRRFNVDCYRFLSARSVCKHVGFSPSLSTHTCAWICVNQKLLINRGNVI